MTPALTAGALLIDAAGRVQFGRRAAWKAAWPDCWDAIGGRVEPGETPEAAVVREVREEVGVTPTRFVLLEVVPEARPELHGEALHYIFAVPPGPAASPPTAATSIPRSAGSSRARSRGSPRWPAWAIRGFASSRSELLGADDAPTPAHRCAT